MLDTHWGEKWELQLSTGSPAPALCYQKWLLTFKLSTQPVITQYWNQIYKLFRGGEVCDFQSRRIWYFRKRSSPLWSKGVLIESVQQELRGDIPSQRFSKQGKAETYENHNHYCFEERIKEREARETLNYILDIWFYLFQSKRLFQSEIERAVLLTFQGLQGFQRKECLLLSAGEIWECIAQWQILNQMHFNRIAITYCLTSLASSLCPGPSAFSICSLLHWVACSGCLGLPCFAQVQHLAAGRPIDHH